MSEELSNEVENFFAEVEAMSNHYDAAEITVPKTNWVVQVDPGTNLPYYCNYVTKETTWNIPDEYQDYLKNYQLYLQKTKAGTQEALKVPKFSRRQVFPEGNARKRRRIKRAWLRANVDKTNSKEDESIEFLSEYIAYSTTSPSSSSNSVSENEPDEPQSPPSNVISDDEKIDTDQCTNSVFIGPRLPSPKPDVAGSDLDLISSEVPSKVSPKPEHLNRSTLLETSQVLIEKFSAIDTHHEEFSPLQIAYVQFATRYEDWKYGYLPNERYSEKLEEVKDFLLQYEQNSLPNGCIWDSDSKQYINQAEVGKIAVETSNMNNNMNIAVNEKPVDVASTPN